MLGNGPHLCPQFMNTGLFLFLIMGEVRLGPWFILAPIGLGNGLHVLGNGPHMC